MAKIIYTEALYDRLERCFQENTFFDVVIQLCGKEFKVHKLVLGMNSDVMDNKFKRGDEASEGVSISRIDMSDEDSTIVEAMLCYMYCSDYSATGNTTDSHLSSMIFNARVYVMAAKYAVEGLKELAAKKFDANATTCWKMNDFVQVINEVYTTTSASEQDLREIVVRIACKHTQAFLQRSNFVAELETNGELGAAVLMGIQLKTEKLSEWSCADCGKRIKVGPALKTGTYYYCMYCGQGRSDWRPVVA